MSLPTEPFGRANPTELFGRLLVVYGQVSRAVMTTPSLFISCFVSVSTLASTGPLAPTALFLFLFSFFLLLYASPSMVSPFSLASFSLTGLED